MGNRRLAFLGLLSGACIACVAIAACNQETPSGAVAARKPDASTNEAGATDVATIKIGAVIGLTGGLRGLAEAAQDTLTTAAAYVNEQAQPLGRRIEVIIEDDGADKTPDGGPLLTAMDKLLNRDKVVAIFGPLGSGQAKVSYPVAKAAKVIELSPTTTSIDLTGNAANPIFKGTDRYYFRTVPPDDLQGKAVARFAKSGPKDLLVDGGPHPGCSKLAVINIDDAYGRGLVPVIEAAFVEGGGRSIALQREVPTARTSFLASTTANPAKVAAEVVASGADCQVIVMYEDIGAAYMKEFIKQTVAPSFFTTGTDGIFTGGFLELARTISDTPTSRSAATNVYGTNADTNPDTDAYREFRAIQITKFPLKPGVKDLPAYAANTFDIVVLIALAVEKAGGTTDGAKLRDALRDVSRGGTPFTPAHYADAIYAIRAGTDVNYEGASGNVDFTPDGNVEAGFIVWKVTQAPNAPPAYQTIERIPADALK